MMSDHTPLPWFVSKSSFTDPFTGEEIEVFDVGPEGDTAIADWDGLFEKEDAEFIARACNSHYDLLEVLHGNLGTFKSLIKEDALSPLQKSLIREEIKDIESAIKKVDRDNYQN